MLAVIVSLVFAAALTLWVSFTTPLPGDVAIAQAIQSTAAPWLDTAMKAVSFLNDNLVAIGGALALAAALAAWRRWPAAAAFLGVLAADMALRIPKAIIHRARPSEDLVRVLESSDSGGFPSGHAFHAVVFFGLVALLVAPHIRSAPLRRTFIALLIGFIVTTGFSRVYLGAHWPSDVLGAFAYGVSSLAAVYYGYKRMKRL